MDEIKVALSVFALSIPSAAMAQSPSLAQKVEMAVPAAGQFDWHRLEPAITIEGRRTAQSLRIPISKWEREKPTVRSGAFWQSQSAAMKWETTFLALSAVDAAQTIRCLKRDLCEEANPIFGKHPSAGTIIASKLGGGLLHYVLINELNKRDPKMALRTAQISAGLQGGVVAMNARIMF
jgi:hypothetical protein